MSKLKILRLPVMLLLIVPTARQTAQCNEPGAATVSIAGVAALLAGHYDNIAQSSRGAATAENPGVPHVTVAIEPTPRADWQLWRVHMDVDPAVAQSAGTDTSLDAVWAMNISRRSTDNSLRLVPYTLRPSVNDATVNAPAFDQTQWLSLEACEMLGEFGKSRVVAQVPGDEMCVAATMGIGGKRAFLPSWIDRDGDWLHVQLTYFGKPLHVDARHRLAQ
jgi:hypothetical protein